MKKKIILIFCCALGAGLFMWKCSGGSSASHIGFATAQVSRGNIIKSVTATGTIEPIVKVEVGTQVSGIVHKLYVDYNSEVKKGQVIAELDKTNLLNELASKKSNMANAQTEYEFQMKNYNRIKLLHEKELVSDTDYEQASYLYENAKNSLDISKNEYAKAQTNLGYATIYSPIDGVVLSKDVEEGQTVAASFSTPTLFYIANDLTQMQVIADVDEADIGGVREGQRVAFEVDAYIGTVFEGAVMQVRQNATTTNNVVTYEVVISAPNPALMLKPGLTANVTIYTLEKHNVVCAPAKAFRFTPDPQIIGKQYIVESFPSRAELSPDESILWTLKDKTFTPLKVVKGTSNNSLTEIKEGISPGTEIVTELKPDAGKGNTARTQENQAQEQSPFMPGPRGNNRKK